MLIEIIYLEVKTMSVFGKILAVGIGAAIGAIAMDVYRDGKENQDLLDIGAVDDNDSVPDEDMDTEAAEEID